ncbi:related to RNA-dependent RNA polymerase [Melanopsichium pennsylvanicum]|uniref:RNA-dependent RNA polymerase n=2 Tax=Melanopsichium pennsylvanicum TaxID=63383 RepID=A0AAJ4XT77_9BASI|nr:related to RNA-dependent RNA polymerase [Melanopsichium pennsylvanicum 4]SNX88027.1 related to RNA-dependent RNA polymerase [Melanopsichium pennsylvanicum]
MEVLVQQIDLWVTEEDLYRTIANALHTPPVRLPGQGLTNFRLLLPKTASNRHKGHAFLTIAETSTASAFLQCYTGKTGRALSIIRDSKYNTLKLTTNGFGNERIINEILHYPYEDWDARQRRLRGEPPPNSSSSDENAVAFLTTVVPTPPDIAQRENLVRTNPTTSRNSRPRRRLEPARSDGAWWTIEFGVICENGDFSIEDYDFPPVPLPSGFDVKSATLYFGDKDNSIRILFNNIVSWSINHNHNALLFDLEDPATFIRQGRNSSIFDFVNHRDRELLIRHRHRYRIGLIGCHFRVSFVTPQDLDWFCLEARPFLKRAGNPRKDPRNVVRRNLTDPDFFEAAGQFCASIDIRVAYQFDKLIRNGLYSPTVLEILKSNTRRLMKLYGVEFAARVLESLAATSRQVQVRDRNTKCLLGSTKLQQRIEAEEQRLKRQDATESDPLASDIVTTATAQVYHVTITPTRMLLEGPFLDSSNRVLRLFPEFGSHFVRVAFADEDGDRFPVSRHDLGGVDSESFVRERIGDPLKLGIAIAGRKFEALAWSGSGLGSHHCWFVAAFTDKEGKLWNAERIRQSLGNFRQVEKQPARYGARLSQAFSATSSTIKINDDWIKIVEDDYSNALSPGMGREKKRYLLTDGVGEISRELLNMIWTELCSVKNMKREWQLSQDDPTRIPSAIQFRCGGAKGVLCLNPSLKGKVMKVRNSMIKFSAPKHRDFEVATTSFSPLPARLNRPLINALEDLGVPSAVFLKLQNKAVESAQTARQDFRKASQLMGSFALSDTAEVHKLFRRLDSLVGIRPDKLHADGILNRLCTIIIAAALGDLKRKARIPVSGCTLIGVVDEFNYLARGEIFAQVNDGANGLFRIVSGRVMIGRSPTIHPGDVRVVNAVVPPSNHPLRQLRNVVVFSKSPEGRPLQSMLSGGDLDGDINTIYEDGELFPTRIESPGQYPDVPPRSLARSCTFEDLADFFVDYVINDQVGLVSIFHLHIADMSEKHSMDADCVKLAQLHAKAVDYRKTGQAVRRKDVPMPPFGTPRPDFIAQRPAGPAIYPSQRALGQLFRAIPEQLTDTPFGCIPSWACASSWSSTKHSALSDILKSPGKSDDILTILSTLGQKYPQVMPKQGLRLVQLQAHFRPLLNSFVYHLSRLAAWIPESRTETEWLSEEEILVGTQVMATKAKQLKRRQERLTASTAELFPILRTQLMLIAGDDSVESATIRSTADAGRGIPGASCVEGKNHGKGKGTSAVLGRDDAEVMHFTGLAQVTEPPRRAQAKIVVIDGERVVLREKPSGSNSSSPWSDDEQSNEIGFDLKHRLNDYVTANDHHESSGSSCNPSRQDDKPKRNQKPEPSGSSNGSGSSTPSGNAKGKGKSHNNGKTQAWEQQKQQHIQEKRKVVATTDPELYQLLYSSDSDGDYGLDDHHCSGRMTLEEIVKRKRRKELHYLYSAAYLGASEVTTRHFGGNTFAVVALGCLLERLEEHVGCGREF